MSAYACEPGKGSEPGAGWAWAKAAARNHEVWLITRKNNRAALERELKDQASLRLQPIYIDFPSLITRCKRGPFSSRIYYLAWQALAATWARKLQTSVQFDVVHHVTFAADWMPIALLKVGAPLVWGPVGGYAEVPIRTYRWLGTRGAVFEILREVVTRPLRHLVGLPIARSASIVLAQNHDVAAWFASRGANVHVEPNVAISRASLPTSDRPGHSRNLPRRAVFVGRLVPLKGLRLAVATIAQFPPGTWTLTVVGDGPDSAAARRCAIKLGIEEFIEFVGALPREEVLDYLAKADALLLPSIHDAAGWAVAEAASMGTPVVGLDFAGPGTILCEREEHWLVSPSAVDLPVVLSRGLRRVAQNRCSPMQRWDDSRLPPLLDQIYEMAVEQGRNEW